MGIWNPEKQDWYHDRDAHGFALKGLDEWRDINIGGISLTQGANNQPSKVTVDTTGILSYSFSSGTTEEVHGVFELQHDYKEGTDIFPHAHFWTTTSNSGDVKIGVEYYTANGGLSGTLSTVKSVTGTAWDEMLFKVGSIDGTNLKIGEQIHTRVFRDGGDATDTYSDSVVIATTGIHYQVSTSGSDNELSK